MTATAAAPVDPGLARSGWRTLEPVHAMIYFAAEAQDEYAAAGLDVPGNRAAGYFPARAAAFGAVLPAVVQASFYNFSPLAVQVGMARAWERSSPERVLAARLRGADRALRRMCGDLLDGPDVAEAVELARAALLGCRPDGRPLYAAHAALPWPEVPHLALWHAVTLLREHRGDGHVNVLVHEQISGLAAGIMHVAQGDSWTREPLRKSRGWTEQEWQDAAAGLRERGWLDEAEAFTDEGRAVRQRVEDRTDLLALPPWQQLGEQAAGRLRELVRPLSRAVLDAGGLGIR